MESGKIPPIPFKIGIVTNNGDVQYKYIYIGGFVEELNYQHLISQLYTEFPQIFDKKHSIISWKDDEGDDILITNNNDLQFAIKSMPRVKKLLIKVANSEADGVGHRKRPHVESLHHPSVICDSCNGPIVGFRYKCLGCSDFDLCQTCEANSEHPQHLMLRVPKPVARLTCDLRGSQLGEWSQSFDSQSNNAEKFHGKKHCRENKQHQPDAKCSWKGSKHAKHHFRCKPDFKKTFSEYLEEYANLVGDLKLEQNKMKGNSSSEPTVPNNISTASVVENILQFGIDALNGKRRHPAPMSQEPQPSTSSDATQQQTTTTNEKPESVNTEQPKSVNAEQPESVNAEQRESVNAEQPEKSTNDQNKESDSSTDSDASSDCVVILSPSEEQDQWTMLNSGEPDENDAEMSVNAGETVAHAVDKNMDAIIAKFQQQMEVCEVDKNQSVETRFVLVNETDSAKSSLQENMPSQPSQENILTQPLQENVPSQPLQENVAPQLSQKSLPSQENTLSQPLQENLSSQPATNPAVNVSPMVRILQQDPVTPTQVIYPSQYVVPDASPRPIPFTYDDMNTAQHIRNLSSHVPQGFVLNNISDPQRAGSNQAQTGYNYPCYVPQGVQMTPVMANALETLTAMGFSNHDNYIMHILQANNCDINATIDFLTLSR